jgi:glutamyl-tRNA reductase
VLPWPALSHALVGADAVITATSAPHPVIYREELQAVLEERAGRPLLIVDIAVPRDVDSAVSELPGVELFDIDELEATLDEDRARREAAVPKVEEIVAEETDDALEWLRSRHIAPLIDQMRTSARAIADAEAQRVIRKLDDLDEREQEVIMRMARQVANKVLHEPIVLLKAEAAADRGMSTTAGDRDAPTSQGDA